MHSKFQVVKTDKPNVTCEKIALLSYQACKTPCYKLVPAVRLDHVKKILKQHRYSCLYEMWPITRGSYYSDFTNKILAFSQCGHLSEVVKQGGVTVNVFCETRLICIIL